MFTPAVEKHGNMSLFGGKGGCPSFARPGGGVVGKAARGGVVSKGVGGKVASGGKAAASGKAAGAAAAAAGKGGKPAKPESRPAGAPPDRESRQQLDVPPVEGMVVRYNNEVGWIKLDEHSEVPEEHKHKLRKGTLFFHSSDVDGDEQPKLGAQVMCFLYTDKYGMGGETLQVLIQGDGEVPKPEKPEKPEGSVDGASDETNPAGAASGRSRKRRGGKSGGKGGKEKGPSGPDLDRERISDMPLTGEVVSWRGKFGWVKPTEPVSHPKAEKHGGKLYAHQQDLMNDMESLEVGTNVQFHVYADVSGLGAEEIELF